MSDLSIRPLFSPEEMDAAVDLQTVYWGADMGALVPAHMLLSIASYGGHVLGAFVDGHLVGMLLGFLGTDLRPDMKADAAQHLLIMSKRMVVLPEYRSKKIGEALKMEQRQIALRQGIGLVTWTYDPLLSRNAYLNLHKLAATGQRYVRNYFGDSSRYSTLSQDRMVVNWWVAHPQTCARLDRNESLRLDQENVCRLDALTAFLMIRRPPRIPDQFVCPLVQIEIPAQFDQVEAAFPELAREWRDYVRAVFLELFDQSYHAIDFIRQNERSYYVFAHENTGLGALSF